MRALETWWYWPIYCCRWLIDLLVFRYSCFLGWLCFGQNLDGSSTSGKHCADAPGTYCSIRKYQLSKVCKKDKDSNAPLAANLEMMLRVPHWSSVTVGSPIPLRLDWGLWRNCAHRNNFYTPKKLYTPALNLQSISEFPRRYISPVSEFSNTLNIAMSIILISPYSHH